MPHDSDLPKSMRSALHLLVAIAIAFSFSTALVPNADAAAITGGTDDAFETPPNVDGIVRYPDLARVDASYDPVTGRLAVAARTHQPVNRDKGHFASYGGFSFGTLQRTSSGGLRSYRCVNSLPGSLNGSFHLDKRAYASWTPGSISVVGYDGAVPLAEHRGDDGVTFAAEATHPALSGRSFNCFSFRVTSYKFSTAANLASRYNESCNCWLVHDTVDVAGEATINGHSPRVAGLAAGDHAIPLGAPLPPHPVCDDGIDNDGDGNVDYPSDPDCGSADGTSEHPQCSDGIDNDGDGRVDLDDVGCLNNSGRTSEADPSVGRSVVRVKASALKRCRIAVTPSVSRKMEPASLFPLGKFSVRITGPKRFRVNRTAPGTGKAVRVKIRRPGTYTIRTTYLGDRFRTKSKATTTKLRVPSKRC